MKMMLTACALALAGLATTAQAQELRLPQSDFEMTMRVIDGGEGRPADLDMRHRNGEFRVDGQFQGQAAVLLLSLAQRTTTILADMGGARMAIIVPMDDNIALPLADERFGEVLGTDRVAGENCTIYRIEDESIRGGEAHGCMTHDNIVLRVHVPGDGNVMEATRFARRAQDASRFVVPEGYQVMRMPGR